MAGLKSPTQTDKTRRRKPLSVVASESLSREGPYLATTIQGRLSCVGLFVSEFAFGTHSIGDFKVRGGPVR